MYDVHDQNRAIYGLIHDMARSNITAECILHLFNLIENSRDVETKEL